MVSSYLAFLLRAICLLLRGGHTVVTLEYSGRILWNTLVPALDNCSWGNQDLPGLACRRGPEDPRIEGIYLFQSLGSQISEKKKLLDLCDIFGAVEWDFTWIQHFHWNFQYTPIIFNKFWFYLSSWTGVFFYNLKIFKLMWLLASFFPINPHTPFQPSPLSNFSLYDKLFQIKWVK